MKLVLELEVVELDVSAMLDGVDREADGRNLAEVEVNPVANTAARRITRGETGKHSVHEGPQRGCEQSASYSLLHLTFLKWRCSASSAL
eukprot:2689896-Amphidinium_carterae.4